ncbi:MAG: hypothetical protein OXE17_00105 [Chloroflexi bacterium]|nr:hypothetical protein [Chloroflexota bacterium]
MSSSPPGHPGPGRMFHAGANAGHSRHGRGRGRRCTAATGGRTTDGSAAAAANTVTHPRADIWTNAYRYADAHLLRSDIGPLRPLATAHDNCS